MSQDEELLLLPPVDDDNDVNFYRSTSEDNNNNNDDEDDDDEEDDDNKKNKNKEEDLAVDNFKFAEDDLTAEVQFPSRHVFLLPKSMESSILNNNNSNNNTNQQEDQTPKPAPLRLFKAPHPRHGEHVLFAIAAASSTSSSSSSSFSTTTSSSTSATAAPEENNNHEMKKRTPMKIFELQSRKPFYSCWFIDNDVEPSSPLYIVSSLHPAFFALRLVIADAITKLGRNEFEKFVSSSAPCSTVRCYKNDENNNNQDDDDATTSSAQINNNLTFRSSEDWTMRATQYFFSSSDNNTNNNNSSSATASSSHHQQQHQQQQGEDETVKSFFDRIPFPDIWSEYLQEGFEAICEKNIISEQGEEVFYRFCPRKTRKFLRHKFCKLFFSQPFEHLVFNNSRKEVQQQQQQQQGEENQNQNNNICKPSSSTDQTTSTSSEGSALLEERALGLLLDYVTKDLPPAQVRRWCLGEARAATNVLTVKTNTVSAFTDNSAERLDETGEAAAKKRKLEEANANKTAGVKKLEKAGAPKGTKSVASFFSVKKKE